MSDKTKYVRESFRLYLPPAVGYNFLLLQSLLKKYRVEKGFHSRAFIISAISAIGAPFRIYERLAYDKKAENVILEEQPVFILGHWRSGTTHLHNLLTQDPEATYISTYQSVFPDQTLASGSRFLFKNIMKMIMPLRRVTDNVKLGADYPQEEEFALASRHDGCLYYFWYFPDLINDYYNDFLNFEYSDAARENCIRDYRRLISKAILYYGKKRFISKNPPNTGRIPLLLDMYPDARFIYIHRNPVEVILSTRSFFSEMLKGLTMHHIDPENLNMDIYKIYERLLGDYMQHRKLIPEKNLIEVRYDDLLTNPMKEIESIYDHFGFPAYQQVSPVISAYADSKKGHVRNKYSIKRSLLDEILSNTDFAMKEWGYDVPAHIEVED